ncbi:unnamed protein product [Mytilus edulis]|uniref:Uncharacterized protein n=1 Tax=Mytilus edulis TaxID=6550 RepID=A0A8S3QGV0_MYTED|nr:unnamed protein product [Mytilus edulis]
MFVLHKSLLSPYSHPVRIVSNTLVQGKVKGGTCDCVTGQEHGKSPKERDTLASLNFDPRHPADRHLNQGALKQLCDALTSANHTCGFMKYHKIILTYKIEPESLDPLYTLESSTRSQSNSSAWHSARRFGITASTFHKIGFRRKKTDPTCLLKTLLYNVRKPTKDMLFGLQQEEPSITRFVQELEKRGKMGLNVQKRGFNSNIVLNNIFLPSCIIDELPPDGHGE